MSLNASNVNILNTCLLAYFSCHKEGKARLWSLIEKLEYCSFEQAGKDLHLTDLGDGRLLPALVKEGLITQNEHDQIITRKVSTLVFEEN